MLAVLSGYLLTGSWIEVLTDGELHRCDCLMNLGMRDKEKKMVLRKVDGEFNRESALVRLGGVGLGVTNSDVLLIFC